MECGMSPYIVHVANVFFVSAWRHDTDRIWNTQLKSGALQFKGIVLHNMSHSDVVCRLSNVMINLIHASSKSKCHDVQQYRKQIKICIWLLKRNTICLQHRNSYVESKHIPILGANLDIWIGVRLEF